LILVGKWGKQGFPQAFPNVVFDKRLFIHLLVFWLEIKKPPPLGGPWSHESGAYEKSICTSKTIFCQIFPTTLVNHCFAVKNRQNKLFLACK
jgi:hypothetical protein